MLTAQICLESSIPSPTSGAPLKDALYIHTNRIQIKLIYIRQPARPREKKHGLSRLKARLKPIRRKLCIQLSLVGLNVNWYAKLFVIAIWALCFSKKFYLWLQSAEEIATNIFKIDMMSVLLTKPTSYSVVWLCESGL